VGAVAVTWSANTEADVESYSIFRSMSPGSGFTLLQAGLTAPSHRDTNVSQGTTYFYRAAAVDSEGLTSELSAVASAAPLADSGELRVDLVTARTSGVAPLAVFFDASGTTSPATSKPFHELRFQWDFGDPGSGTWAHSGRIKNTATGPMAGHVFEEPGTYTVRVTVQDGDGNASTEQVTVEVDDPDEVFAGANTICFSSEGDFTGAPSGAQRITTTSLSTVIQQAAAGRRLLLRRGETWSTSSTLDLNVPGPGIIGSFGPGDRPLIRMTGDAIIFRLSGQNPRLNDWRLMDMQIDGMDAPDSRAVRSNGTCTQILLLRLSARDVHNGFSFNTSQIDYWFNQGDTRHVLYDQMSIVECTVNRVTGGGGGNGSMLAGRRVLFLGNTYDDTREAEHVMRLPHLDRAVLSHNDLRRPATTKHVVKMHGPPMDSPGVGQGEYTQKVLFSHNTLQGDNTAWTLATGPEDNHTDQRVRDVLLEGNYFLSGVGTQVAMYLAGESMTVRNNLIDCTGGVSNVCIQVSRRGIEPNPRDISIFNNTGYGSSDDRFTFVQFGSSPSDIRIFNNLGVAPNAPSRNLVGGTATNVVTGNNLLTADGGFSAANPTEKGDFRLAADSPAVDAGQQLEAVWDDFEGNSRPAGDGSGAMLHDLGAFERVAQGQLQ
jgi:PKD repeat protein